MKLWVLLQGAALLALCVAQQECERGACYPPVNELLLGGESEIKASSTCGLAGIEIYCTPLGQWKMKCCPCDSRNPAGRNAHTIQDVLGPAGPDRWWQSKKDVSPVTIDLDLKQLFQLDTLLLHFKGPRPDALVIERSVDFGRSWTPALYMATDCKSTFPNITMETTYDLNSPHCYTLSSNINNPFQDQRVYFYPLLQFSSVNLPQEHKINKLSGYTSLRVRLIQFGAVPYTPGRHPSRFYALKEIKVTGSCFCHGHAQRCLSDSASNYLPNTQVNKVCVCQHNTAGMNCERCADLYNDLPWQPAERDNTHTCKRCECNNHAERCYFDPELYERSGRSRGGVCECKHHTAGDHCERCAINYYRNPQSTTQSPDTCLPCQCDGVGSEGCDEITGACRCKANVEGRRCDRCKPGHYDLRATNTLGCSRCSCSLAGSLHAECDAVMGRCVCRPHVEGRSCDRCAGGYWNSSSSCQRCNCDIRNSISTACDQVTGQCSCRPGFGGRTCSACPENTYGDTLTGCKACVCDRAGTVPGGCDGRTGVCVCREGVFGDRCDMCSRGRCEQFPHCPVCPSCFFSLEAELQNLTHWMLRLPHTPPPSSAPTDALQRITSAQLAIRRITDSLSRLPDDGGLYSEHSRRYGILRSELITLADDLRRAGYSPPDLKGALVKLQNQLFELRLVYDAKKEASSHVTDPDYTAALAAVKHAYSRSTDAVKLAEGTSKLLDKSASIRGDTLRNLNLSQPINTKNLQQLGLDLATRPDLAPAAEQVCGSKRERPCTPLHCEGEVCPADPAPPCGRDEKCVGALPWSSGAVRDSEDVKNKLQLLNKKITEAHTQIQETQDQANKVRLSTDEVSNQIKRTRDDIDEELGGVKVFIQRLKDFLSDPSSDPTAVQRVCDGVLGVKLPETVDALKNKLKEIQDVAASLPDSSMVLKNAESQLEQAHRLLKDAENARDTAAGLQDQTDGVLKSLNGSESALNSMQDKLQQSLDLIDLVKQDIANVEEVLTPAENLVKDGSGLIDSLRPLLDSLGEDVIKGRTLAKEAEKQAEGAEQEAKNAAQDLTLLQDQLLKLKQNANASNQSSATGKVLHSLQGEATALIQDTADIMNLLNDKEASLQGAREELLNNSLRLNGLEEELQHLLTDIRTKATRLNQCQG